MECHGYVHCMLCVRLRQRPARLGWLEGGCWGAKPPQSRTPSGWNARIEQPPRWTYREEVN